MVAIDDEVGCNAYGQRHGANHVLNHAIGCRFVQFTVCGQGSDVFATELSGLCDEFSAFLNAEFVQSFHSTVLDRHGLPV